MAAITLLLHTVWAFDIVLQLVNKHKLIFTGNVRGVLAKCIRNNGVNKKENDMLYIGNHTSSSKGYAAMGRQMVKMAEYVCIFTRNQEEECQANDPADVASSGDCQGA